MGGECWLLGVQSPLISDPKEKTMVHGVGEVTLEYREPTLMECIRDHGRIVQDGTYAQLAACPGVFKHLLASAEESTAQST